MEKGELEEKLEDKDWKVVLKALAGIVLVTTRKTGVADYFDSNNRFILDDPESLTPTAHVFWSEHLSWLEMDDGLKKFKTIGGSPVSNS